MVKIQDGSLVSASDLLSGNGEDDEGNRLKFEQVKEANTPTYRAKQKMGDNSGRTRVYQFSFEDTNVTVHQSFVEAEKEEKNSEGEGSNDKTTAKNEDSPLNKPKPFTVEKAGFTTTSPSKK